MKTTKNLSNTAFCHLLVIVATVLLGTPIFMEAQTTTATMSFRSLIGKDKEELGNDSLRLNLDLFEDVDFNVPIKLENVKIEGAKIEGRDPLNTLILDVTDPNGDVKVVVSDQKLRNVALSIAHLVALDITQCPDLQIAEFTINELEKIDLSNNKELQRLNVAINNLSSLDLSHNPKLTLLDCGFNKFSSPLDLSNNLQLETLYTSENKNLSSLDLSRHEALKTLVSPNCALTSLKLSPTGALQRVMIYGNKLERKAIIDLSGSIPTREKEGWLAIINTQDPNEGNVCWKEDVERFKVKNWRVVDVNGDGTDPKEFTANGAVENLARVTIYPNPARKATQITSPYPVSIVQIYDSYGASVYQGVTSEDGSCNVDLSGLCSGIYIVTIGNYIKTTLLVR